MDGIPEGNHLVDCQAFHAEVLDRNLRFVWQSHLPMTREEYERFEPPAPFVKIGLGRGVMDAHYFRRSPGAALDGPVAEQIMHGLRFIHCANPPAQGAENPVAGGPSLLRVDKHHSLVFHAGRQVNVMRLPGGTDYVQVIAASPEGGGLLQDGPATEHAMTLPDGWAVRRETCRTDTTVHLPNPTEAWFFPDGSSYQGPVGIFNGVTA